jgi:predicted AAA+ superfamily ATPase
MLGQLADAGNTTTLAHYLELLRGAGMLAGLAKYDHGQLRQRGSSPKLQVLNTALMSAQDSRSLIQARHDGEHWGRLVESCVGAHLFNSSFGTNISVAYWREGNQEVDFVLQEGKTTVAIEVKSGIRPASLPGMEAFVRQFKPKRQLLVGAQGIALEEFLSKPASHWLQ